MTIKAVAFDLDGTIYYGNQPAEGALETINFIRDKGLSVYYFTNNSTTTRLRLLEKLQSMGFDPHIDDIYSSASAAAKYVKHKSLNEVYCLGSQGLIYEFNEVGIEVVTAEKAEAMVIGLDFDVSYNKITEALNFARKNDEVIVCNKDRNYPVENNELRPGCGSLVAAIEFASGKTFDCIVGKPNTYMMELLLAEKGLLQGEILVVGDTYESDMAMANKIGCPAVLISEQRMETNVTVIKRIGDLKNIWEKINGNYS